MNPKTKFSLCDSILQSILPDFIQTSRDQRRFHEGLDQYILQFSIKYRTNPIKEKEEIAREETMKSGDATPRGLRT